MFDVINFTKVKVIIMITGEIKNRIDKIWDAFWTGRHSGAGTDTVGRVGQQGRLYTLYRVVQGCPLLSSTLIISKTGT